VGSRIAIVLIIAAAAAGAFFLFRKPPAPPRPLPPVVAPTPPPAPPPTPDAAPAIRNPVESAGGPRVPSLAESDAFVKNALSDLLGRKALAFFNIDGFVRRFVTTVDNLGGEHASSQQWPVVPTSGGFEAEGGAIGARNAARYAAFVRLVDAADTHRVVALYKRLYPLFQQAYEELGYPGKYFNDRVVEVIDELLATPELPQPIKVKALQVQPGRAALYQFEDPALEARSSGQKILLRVGPENAARLKAKLTEFRREIARSPGGHP
jgi:hypothetical protein